MRGLNRNSWVECNFREIGFCPALDMALALSFICMSPPIAGHGESMHETNFLERDWHDGGLGSPFHRAMTFTQAGLVLGRGTLVASFAKDAWGKGQLATAPLFLDGHEARILSLLTAA
jgi:hypothetical protein